MTATVDIITEIRKDVLTVPLSAATTRSKKDENKTGTDKDKISLSETEKKDELNEVVFVVEEEIVVMKEIKTGISDFDNIEILEGLNLGDNVILGSFLTVSKRLKDGSNIKITNK